MKIAMIAPDKRTEKGIAIYSTTLSKYIKKHNVHVDILRYKLGSFFSLLKIIPKLGFYDIVHIQHEYGLFGRLAGEFFIFLIMIIGLFKRGKLIITMHSVYPRKEKRFSRHSWISQIRKTSYYIQNKLIGLFSTKIVVHASFLAELLRKDYNINKNKIVIIPHGVRNDVPRLNKNSAKKKLNLSGNVYLVMGNMSRMKGTDIPLKVARAIGKTILLAGHSDFRSNVKYLKELENYINNNSLNDIVRFDKRKMDATRPLWWLYFAAADLVILPYRRMTTSGIFNDAMASKKPVIASNTRFFREISKKFKCLKIAKRYMDYPKLIRNATRPKMLAMMEKECERYAKDYSLSVISRKYKSLYESLA